LTTATTTLRVEFGLVIAINTQRRIADIELTIARNGVTMAIRPDNDPNSAAPRSGAPKSELEQYGVWVKAEPQDIVEEVASPGAAGMDFDFPGESASVSEESFLSEDEEKLLGSFDSEFDSAPSPSAEETGPLPDIEDMPPLEESLLPSEPLAVAEDLDAGTIDIKLEEFESAGPPSTIHPGVEIDMSSVEGLDNPDASERSASSAIEDVSSEFLDVIEEPEAPSPSAPPSSSGSSDFGSGMDDVTAEFLDIEESIAPPRAVADSSAEFEPLDIDLHFDDSVGSSDSASPLREDSGFESVTEFDDFLTVDSSKPASQEPGFDDVSAVERDLASPAASRAPASTAEAPRPDLSTEILLKIADELSSIRGELVSLKAKIGDVMGSSEASPPKAAESADSAEEDAAGVGGFFDEEEDETIALTGDELDNILNTADFTTEEASEAEEPIELDADALSEGISSSDDGDLLDESLLPESGDYSPPSMIEPAIEEVRIGEADSVDEIGEEADGLGLVAEEGVTPVTQAPEDTSYLESPESLGIEGGAPPDDEPLVEPDLSDFDLGPEDLEPRLEVDEELPLAGGGASGSSSSPTEEMTLNIEAGPDYIPDMSFEEGVAEAEFIESVPEIEETNFSEINLHEETDLPPSASDVTEVEEIDALSDMDISIASEPSAASEEGSLVEEEEDLILSAEEVEPPPPYKAPIQAPAAPAPKAPSPAQPQAAAASESDDGDRLKSEIKSVLSYLDKLLDSLPEEKIEEFARSKYFDTYKKLFEELGLV
jgi:pilus assembly protein FimV